MRRVNDFRPINRMRKSGSAMSMASASLGWRGHGGRLAADRMGG